MCHSRRARSAREGNPSGARPRAKRVFFRCVDTRLMGPPSLASLAGNDTPVLEEIVSLEEAAQIAAPFPVVQRKQFFRPCLSALDEFVQWLQETVFAGP